MSKKLISIIVMLIMLLTIIISLNSINAKQLTNNFNKVITLNNNGGGGTENRWAVLVGTSPASYCDNDAEDMYSVLTTYGWESSHIKKYTKSSATKDNITSGISWMVQQADSDDIVLFFFAGHGGRRAIADYWGNLISLIELKAEFFYLKSSKQVLIFDTCHAGSLLVGDIEPELRSRYFNYIGDGGGEDEVINDMEFFGLSEPGRVIIASCRAYESSYGLYEFKNGIFTYYFESALKTKDADNNGDGWISAEEAFDYSRPKVIDKSNDFILRVQHPKMYDGVIDQVKLTNAGKSHNVEISLFI